MTWNMMNNPPPPKKPRRNLGFKTSPPLNRGKPSHRKVPAGDDDLTDAQVAALASSHILVHPELVKKRDKAEITEFAVTFGSNPTRRKFLQWAKNALLEWKQEGNIPNKAVLHLEKNHALVWPTIPFVKRILKQRQELQQANAAAASSASAGASTASVSAGPSCHDPVPGCSRTETVTTEQQEVTFPADLFDEESDLWVDVLPDEGEESDDGLEISSEHEDQQIADFLDAATVSFLQGTNRRKEDVSWERIMKYWFTYANVGLEYISTLMKWIKANNAVLTQEQIRQLPLTGKTFLKLTELERKSVHAIKSRDEAGNEIGTYMHYGLMNAVLGTSPGLTEHIEQKELLRRAHLTFPQLLSDQLLNSINPLEDEVQGDHCLVSSKNKELWKLSMTLAVRSPTVVVRVQGSSDCVQPQKTLTSTVRAVMGSLDSIYSPILGLVVPIPRTPPFLIGVYKGGENKDDQVLQTLVSELNGVSPPPELSYPEDGKHEDVVESLSRDCKLKKVYCEFSYWVADAVERCALLGTLGHAGIMSCPRCTLRGYKDLTSWQKKKAAKALTSAKKKHKKTNTPYFLSVNGPPRKDSDWDTYTELSGLGEPTPYRTRRNPLMEKVFPGRMITAFVLDSMHTLDGGTCKDFLERITTPTTSRKVPGFITPAGLIEVQYRITQIQSTWIKEFARKLRPLSKLGEFKMREVHVFFMFAAYPTFYYAEESLVKDEDGKEQILTALRFILTAMHLTKGFSPYPVPKRDLDDAKMYMKDYVQRCMTIFGDQWANGKNHWAAHILDDCENHKFHLERGSAYKYESRYRDFGEYLRSGNKPLEQVRNRYLELRKYHLYLDDEGNLKDFSIDEREVAVMRRTQRIELPDSYIRRIRVGRGGKELVCEAYTISTHFPNNIVLLQNNVVIYCVDFHEDDDMENPGFKKFSLTGFEFKLVKSAWLHPTESSRIGLFHASKLDLESFPATYPGLKLVGKCFVAPRGPDIVCPHPISDPVPKEYHADLESYRHTESKEMRVVLWERMKTTYNEILKAQQLQGAPSVLSNNYLWVHSLTLPGRYQNFFQ